MNFHQIFIEIATAPTIPNGFLWNYVHLLSRSVFTSSSFQFFLICIFFFFYEFSSNFHWNRYCSYSFQWIPLQLCTLILWVSLHIIFADFWNLYFFIFWLNFHPSFIQIATAPTIFNGFLWNYHGEDGLSCRPCIKFSGGIGRQASWWKGSYNSGVMTGWNWQKSLSNIFRHYSLWCF